MILFVFIPLCFTMKQIPFPMNNYLKNNIQMSINYLQEKDILWEKTTNCKNIINKYFYKMNTNNYDNNNNNYYGEMFKIFGYPATLIIINNEFKYVEEFIINKNLILMFDASPLLRSSFYKKYKNINIKNAINNCTFLII